MTGGATAASCGSAAAAGDSASEGRRRASSQPSAAARKTHAEDRNLQLTIILILVSSSYVLAYIPVLLHFVMWKIQLSGLIAVSRETLTIVGKLQQTSRLGVPAPLPSPANTSRKF